MKKILPFVFATLCIYSCSKSTSPRSPGNTDSTSQTVEVAVPVDIYIGCTIGKIASSQPGYWKNGTLYPVSEKHYAWFALSVFPVGNDIYLCGGHLDTVGYWKNGLYTALLPSDHSTGIGMDFSGTDRYEVCSGLIGGQPVGGLYKNDVLQIPGSFSGVVTDGDDVYLYGTIPGQSGKASAAIWKNGVLQQLGHGNNASFVNSLVVSNGNTFACGYEMDDVRHVIAHYWRNGIDSLLSDSSAVTIPSDIAVSAGGNVYILGSHVSGTLYTPGNDTKELLWKNGKLIDFIVPAGTIGATRLAVNGPDVYTMLSLPSSDPEANKFMLWKNGTVTPIGEESQDIIPHSLLLVKK